MEFQRQNTKRLRNCFSLYLHLLLLCEIQSFQKEVSFAWGHEFRSILNWSNELSVLTNRTCFDLTSVRGIYAIDPCDIISVLYLYYMWNQYMNKTFLLSDHVTFVFNSIRQLLINRQKLWRSHKMAAVTLSFCCVCSLTLADVYNNSTGS